MVSSKPWLNYKGALADVAENMRTREIAARQKRKSYGWALFWLIFFGLIGAHKFYIGDKRTGWCFVVIYLLFIMMHSVIISNFSDIVMFYTAMLFNVYWVSIIALSYRQLKRDVTRINEGAIAND